MKKLLASVLCVIFALGAIPVQVTAADRAAEQAGSISGAAVADGKALANVTVRLRAADGTLAGSTTANAAGEFSFTGLGPGNFVVETVAQNGTLLGSSATISLTTSAMVATNVVVSASAAAIAAAGGMAAVAGGAAAGGISSTALVIGAIAAGLGVTGVAVALNDSSPSS